MKYEICYGNLATFRIRFAFIQAAITPNSLIKTSLHIGLSEGRKIQEIAIFTTLRLLFPLI